MVGLGAGLFALAKAGIPWRRYPQTSSAIGKLPDLPDVKREPRAVARKNPFA